MKIVHVGSSLSRLAGGVAPVMWELAKYQQQHGVEVKIAGLKDDFTEVDALSFSTVPYYAATNLVAAPFGYSIGLQKHFRVELRGIDLIHSHGLWMHPGFLSWKVAQKFNIPFLITTHGMVAPYALANNWWKKRIPWYLFQRRILASAQVLHATSRQEAQDLRTLGFQNPIAVIPNGINVPPQRASKQAGRDRHTVLFLSRLHKIKGLLNLVEAWAQTRPVGWRVIVAGPDEENHQAEVECAVGRLGLDSQFSFIGPVENENKWELFGQADLFILPSYSENFGIVIAEALASGVPVITTKGTPWAKLEEYKCGWWIDIGVEPLVKALTEAINLSPKERHTMGHRGRQLVEQNYTWDTIGEDMLSVYKWVLDGGKVPGCVVFK